LGPYENCCKIFKSKALKIYVYGEKDLSDDLMKMRDCGWTIEATN
jgi:hypothetical protein